MNDATRFLLRYYQTIASWPLQIYNSAIVFSPETSAVRRNNLDKVPSWLRRLPQVEHTWGSLQKTLQAHSGLVSAIAFSPDGRHIASGSDDETIKLWNITKSLKLSKVLGRTIGSHLKFRRYQKIQTSGIVHSLRFSKNYQDLLITDPGLVRIQHSNANRPNHDNMLLGGLWVGNEWIHYGSVPIIRLAPDVQPRCFDVKEDQVAIGFGNGDVLSFDIHYISLYSALE